MRQHKEGPRTTRGVNLLTGEEVWLSTQAPLGYVRVNEPAYWNLIDRAIQRMKFAGETAGEIWRELNELATEVANKMADIIKHNAPVDKGTLRDEITAVLPGDELLNETPAFEDQILEEELGGE